MRQSVRIVVLGDRDPGYVTHRALDATLALLPPWADAGWVGTDAPGAAALDGVDGLWVAPGSPYRDDDAVLRAIAGARRDGVPCLGSCGGFQYAMLVLARDVPGLEAAHAETAPDAAAPVIAPLACSLVGERRTVTPVAGTRLAAACGTAPFTGFHWCRFGLAGHAVEPLAAAGAVVAARAPDAGVEAIELPAHPFFVATLFQPQAVALEGGGLHPLVAAFAEAARRRAAARVPAPTAAATLP